MSMSMPTSAHACTYQNHVFINLHTTLPIACPCFAAATFAPARAVPRLSPPARPPATAAAAPRRRGRSRRPRRRSRSGRRARPLSSTSRTGRRPGHTARVGARRSCGDFVGCVGLHRPLKGASTACRMPMGYSDRMGCGDIMGWLAPTGLWRAATLHVAAAAWARASPWPLATPRAETPSRFVDHGLRRPPWVARPSSWAAAAPSPGAEVTLCPSVPSQVAAMRSPQAAATRSRFRGELDRHRLGLAWIRPTLSRPGPASAVYHPLSASFGASSAEHCRTRPGIDTRFAPIPTHLGPRFRTMCGLPGRWSDNHTC